MKINLEKYKGIILDCDGVIFDSNLHKEKAFRETLSNYPEVFIEDFIEYNRENSGISRYIKFKYFLEHILKKKYDIDEYELLLSKFSHHCDRLYLNADYTYNFLPIIKKLYNRFDLFVASGSDEIQLQNIFKKKNIKKFFSHILGSPKNKTECIQIILNQNFKASELVFIGDSIVDYYAASSLGIDFIFMYQYSENYINFNNDNYQSKSIKNLFELMNYF